MLEFISREIKNIYSHLYPKTLTLLTHTHTQTNRVRKYRGESLKTIIKLSHKFKHKKIRNNITKVIFIYLIHYVSRNINKQTI